MRIQSVRVKNYRSIRDARLSIGDITALVGRNGSGKSTFLSALDLFYNRGDLTEADFFGENMDEEIEVEITFDRLSQSGREEFSPYLEGNTLTVVGVYWLDSGKPEASYHGSSLQNPDFANIRRLSSKREQSTGFNALLDDPRYSSLDRARSADAAEAAMKQWELANPDACVRTRDDGQFFGWTNVGIGRLNPHTQFIRVPAVRDAGDDATDRRGSAITEIMNLVVRSALDADPQLAELRESTQRAFEQIMKSDAGKRLTSLQGDLTASLRSFVPDSAVDLQWEQVPEFSIPQPQAHVRLQEDGYPSTVTRTGHGLQRAFIFTLLQRLAAERRPRKVRDDPTDDDAAQPSDESGAPAAPDVVLAIEEPELYQHPSRQRHITRVFTDLAQPKGSDEATTTQIIYTTHSPLFVELDRFDDVRILRKVESDNGTPKSTGVRTTTLEVVTDELQRAAERDDFTSTSLRARLEAIMTPMVNEGFFADVAVLVEGESDRSAIVGAARAMDIRLDAQGVAVIPCGGKTNLDRPLVIFRSLGIPTYVVWDSDKGKKDAKPGTNRLLLRILGKQETEWPCHVDAESACFETTIEGMLKSEIGSQAFEEHSTEAQQFYGLAGDGSSKNALVMQRTVEKAFAQGHQSTTLKIILEKIMELKAGSASD